MASNNVVIVTGASRAIGKAISLSLIKQGISVVGLARSADALDTVAQEAGAVAGSSSAKFIPVVGDVTDDAVQQSAVDLATKQGTLVALVNNAAIVEPIEPIASADFDAWAKHLQINFITPFQLIQKVLPLLRSVKGRIINLSSNTSEKSYPMYAIYGAGKSAINYATATLAAEEPEVTAIAIHPGVVDTPMLGKVIENVKAAYPGAPEEAADRILKISIKTDVPGATIANLALRADHSLSGKYVRYDDPEVAEYAQQ
ncbi:hypothetical protein GGI12_004787 [Dipsacomyces acuminosporus]|nr:hypothetical protein GGI12_004787 [Dipsacomyces acuminosporus]